MARNTGRPRVPPSRSQVLGNATLDAASSSLLRREWTRKLPEGAEATEIQAMYLRGLGGSVIAPSGFWALVEADDEEAVTLLVDIQGEAKANWERLATRPLPSHFRSGADFAPANLRLAETGVAQLSLAITHLAEAIMAGTVDAPKAAARYRELRDQLEHARRSLLEAEGKLDAIKAGLLSDAARSATRQRVPAAEEPPVATGLQSVGGDYFIVDETHDWAKIKAKIKDAIDEMRGPESCA